MLPGKYYDFRKILREKRKKWQRKNLEGGKASALRENCRVKGRGVT